jgi:Tol biopolymer transport system component
MEPGWRIHRCKENIFTSTRSLGAGEMWLYHISGGAGLQLTVRKNDQQDVNEPVFSPDGRYVYYSEDNVPRGDPSSTIKIPITRCLLSNVSTGRKVQTKQ